MLHHAPFRDFRASHALIRKFRDLSLPVFLRDVTFSDRVGQISIKRQDFSSVDGFRRSKYHCGCSGEVFHVRRFSGSNSLTLSIVIQSDPLAAFISQYVGKFQFSTRLLGMINHFFPF